MGERTDYGPVLGSGWIHLFAAITAVLAVVLFWSWFKDPMMRQAGTIALVVGLIPGGITLFRLWRLRSAMGEADLRLDGSLPLGYSGTATYFRPLRGAEVRSVEARLQCEEEVVKGSGRQRRRRQKIVHDQRLEPTVTPMMERIEVRIPMRIPATGPPTIWYEEASTTWWLRLRLKMSGCPDTASSFRIEVVPAVAER